MAEEPPGLLSAWPEEMVAVPRSALDRRMVLTGEALELDGGSSLAEALLSLPRCPAQPARAPRGCGSTLSGAGGAGGFPLEVGLTAGLSHAGQRARCFLRGTPPCLGGCGPRLALGLLHSHTPSLQLPLSASGAPPAKWPERRDGINSRGARAASHLTPGCV